MGQLAGGLRQVSHAGLIVFAILMGFAFFAILWTAIDSAKHRAENNHRGVGRIEAALSNNNRSDSEQEGSAA